MSGDRSQPPRLAKWLLRRMTRFQEDYAISGDLEEVYHVIRRESGPARAIVWFWYQTLASLFLYALAVVKWRLVMLGNYLKIAFRSYYRNRGLTAVNLAGLSIGVAAFVVIVLYVSFESSYDTFHPNSRNIYRIRYDLYRNGEKAAEMATTVPAIAGALKENFSEVTEYARATRQFLEYAGFSFEDKIAFRASRIFVVTPSFLKMFHFPLVKGDPETALSGPLRAVITAAAAERYFRGIDPLGKIIVYNTRDEYEITGVCADPPPNSHFKFDMLLSYASLPYTTPIGPGGEEAETDWYWSGFYTYLTLKEGTVPRAFQAKLNRWVADHRGQEWKNNNLRQEFILQPLEEIHLSSNLSEEVVPEERGSAQAVKVLKIIAGFILILAWVNYINISTSRALSRAREVGIRKVSGAYRYDLIKQFLLEYVGLMLAAAVISFAIIEVMEPYLVRITGTEFSFLYLLRSPLWLKLGGSFVGGTLLVGLYPSVLLSSFRPADVLKGRLMGSPTGVRIRKFLTLLQLTVSVGLIAGTLIIFQQISFMLQKDLGIDIEQTLVVHAPGMNEAPPPVWSHNIESFLEETTKYPFVESAVTTTSVPGEEVLWGQTMRKSEDQPRQAISIRAVGIDDGFIPAFGIELLAGRNFSSAMAEEERAVILNRAAMNKLGFTTPEDTVNRKLVIRGRDFTVIGILSDYHQHSLRTIPGPLAYLYSPHRGYVAFKLKPDNLLQTTGWLRTKWREHFPGIPFDYFFLDESFNRHYQNDRRFSRIFALFTGLTVFIACLGIFALASLNTVQRTKEIGIRKAMGASVSRIYGMLSREFLRLVFFASLVAVPFTYLQMNKWLENFAYRVSIAWWVFAISWAAVSLVVLVTISYQSLKAALADPVEALRNE